MGGNGWLGRIPLPLPPHPITPSVFVLRFDFKNASGQGCGEAPGRVADSPVHREWSRVQFSFFRAGVFGWEKGECALSGFGARPKAGSASLHLVSRFTSPPPSSVKGDRGGHGRPAGRLCSPTPHPTCPSSCLLQLSPPGARNHNNSNSYHHNDAANGVINNEYLAAAVAALCIPGAEDCGRKVLSGDPRC